MLTWFSLLKTLFFCFIIKLCFFLFIQKGREGANVGRELFHCHFLGCGGGWSGGRWLRNSGFSLFFWTVAAEVASLFASEAETILHQVHSFLVCHCFEGFGNNVHVHGVVISLLPEVPTGLSFVLFLSVPPYNPLDFVVIIVDFEGLLVPSLKVSGMLSRSKIFFNNGTRINFWK